MTGAFAARASRRRFAAPQDDGDSLSAPVPRKFPIQIFKHLGQSHTRVRDLAAGFARVLRGSVGALRKQRAQGMPGGQCTRSLACKIKQAHERRHHGHTGFNPAFPAQWFYGLFRALPGDEFVLSPSLAD